MHRSVWWISAVVSLALALVWSPTATAKDECPQDCDPGEKVGGCCPVADEKSKPDEAPKPVEKKKRDKRNKTKRADPSVAEGDENGACYGNGTCNAGLVCLDDVCLQPPTGTIGGACYGNGTCNDGGLCVDARCVDEAAQHAADAQSRCFQECAVIQDRCHAGHATARESCLTGCEYGSVCEERCYARSSDASERCNHEYVACAHSCN